MCPLHDAHHFGWGVLSFFLRVGFSYSVDFCIDLFQSEFWFRSGFCFSSDVTDGFYRLFAYALVGVCCNGEGDAAGADDSAHEDVDGSVGAHAKLFAELVEFRFLHGVQTDGHCCLCHDSSD